MKTIVLELYSAGPGEYSGPGEKSIRRPNDWPGKRHPYIPFGIGSLVRLNRDPNPLWRVVRIGQGRGKKALT